METYVAALGTVIAVFVLMRMERGEWSARFERFDTGLRGEVGALRGEFAGLRTEFGGLRGEFAGLRTQFTELRTEVKGDIAELRTEVKGDIADLRTEVKGDIAELRTEVKGDIAGLRADHDQLRLEMRDGFLAVNGRIDRVMDALVRHVQEGHPPHQAA